jgi:hypothetical protein
MLSSSRPATIRLLRREDHTSCTADASTGSSIPYVRHQPTLRVAPSAQVQLSRTAKLKVSANSLRTRDREPTRDHLAYGLRNGTRAPSPGQPDAVGLCDTGHDAKVELPLSVAAPRPRGYGRQSSWSQMRQLRVRRIWKLPNREARLREVG